VSKLFALLQAMFEPRISDAFLQFWAKHLLDALLIVALFWLLSELARIVLNRWGRVLARFTKTELNDRILKLAIPNISLMLNVFGLYLAIRSLPLPEKFVAILSGLLYITLVVILFNLVYSSFGELLKWYVDGRAGGSDANLSRQMLPLVEKLTMLFLMGAGLIIVLKHFNYDIFSLVTALGIGSLAIGMAAKDTLAHMISGFTLMLDRPFDIGDRIKLTNGQIGDVIEIGLRSTKIQGLDTTVMIIPNSDLCNSTVINLVRPTAVIQGRISIGVGYGSDVDQVKQLLLKLADSNQDVVKTPAPEILFTSFGDSALNMLFIFWVNEPGCLGQVTDQLNCSILRCFRENNIEIPYPTRTVIMEKEQLCPTE
jgi:MscS family membrane protein